MSAWWRLGWNVYKGAAFRVQTPSALIRHAWKSSKCSALLVHASPLSNDSNCMQGCHKHDETDLQESHSNVKQMTQVALKEVNRAQRRWMEQINHHLEESRFNEMNGLFREAVREKKWDEFSPEMQKAIATAAAGKTDALMPHFVAFMTKHFPELSKLDRLREVSDLSSPAQWFPAARKLQRKFVFHVGPTNSGKTHMALQSFYSSSSGIYCAPLRLLAAEIFQRCNAEGVPCDLLTGEERVQAEQFEAAHLSCTVEMTSTSGGKIYDVGIVDEIQMIADDERGSAWTRAVLGLPAREIHLCGNGAALNIVKRILSTTGDHLEVKNYSRLSPLVPGHESLYMNYRNVQKGDCIVAFSREKIFQLKKEVESATGMLCAVIYGGLPSVTRIEQAKLFNDPSSKYDVLVASDAIGMGLNLNIRRLVFSTLMKRNHQSARPETLTSTQVKQIGGRAGRYQSQFPTGEVSTFDKRDLGLMKKLIGVPEKDIVQAGLSPSFEQIEMFSKELPNASLDEILGLFHQLACLDGLYFLCDLDKKRVIAQELKDLNLPLFDAYMFCLAPVDSRESIHKKAIQTFAQLYADNKSVTVDVLKQLMSWPLQCPLTSGEQLRTFEVYHEMIDLYQWLGMRYPQHFPDEEEARKLQETIVSMIGHTLSAVSRPRRRSRMKLSHAQRELSDTANSWSGSDNHSYADARLPHPRQPRWMREGGQLKRQGYSHQLRQGNSHQLGQGNSHQLRQGNSHQLRQGNSHQSRQGNSHQLRQGNSHQSRQGNSHQLRQGNSHQLRQGNSHQLRQGNSHQLRQGNSHQFKRQKRNSCELRPRGPMF